MNPISDWVDKTEQDKLVAEYEEIKKEQQIHRDARRTKADEIRARYNLSRH